MLLAIFLLLTTLTFVWMIVRSVYRALVFLIISAPIIAVIVAFAIGRHFS